jgi:hypothetical protein
MNLGTSCAVRVYNGKMRAPIGVHGSVSTTMPPVFRQATELTHDAVDLADYAQCSLALIASVLGHDVAAIQVGVGRDRFAPLAVTGVDGRYLTQLKARWPVYASELLPLARAARTDGIAIDTNLDSVARERSRYFQEIVAPQRGGTTLFCDLGLRGAKLGMLMLGRRSSFAVNEIKLLSQLRPLLALGMRSYVTDEFARATSSKSESPLARISTAIEALTWKRIGITPVPIPHSMRTNGAKWATPRRRGSPPRMTSTDLTRVLHARTLGREGPGARARAIVLPLRRRGRLCDRPLAR